MLKKYGKASYTLEAAMLMPLILLSIFQGMKTGIDLCSEVQRTSVYSKELEELNGVEIFLKKASLEDLWENVHGDGI